MNIQEFLSRLDGVKQSGAGYIARCPHHDDKQQSLGISEGSDGRILLNCFAGCETRDIVKVMSLEMKDLFPENGRGDLLDGRYDNKLLTVEALAWDKGLPATFLINIGVKPVKHGLQITYRDNRGNLAPRQRKRSTLKAKDTIKAGNKEYSGSSWTGDKSKKPICYGGWLLKDFAEKHDYIVFVEGESDSWTLWYHDLPCIGVPGADHGNKIQKGHISVFKKVFIWKEHGQSGETFFKSVTDRIAKLEYSGEIFVIQSPDYDDPNDLHKATMDRPGAFLQAWHEILERVEPVNLQELWKAAAPVNGKNKPIVPAISLEDTFNAEQLVKNYGQNIRYCHPWRSWMIYDGKKWERDNVGHLMRLAKQTARGLYPLAAEIEDDTLRENLLKHIRYSLKTAGKRAMIESAQSENFIPILPEEFDRDKDYFNCENGVIDLRTGELLPHKSEYFISKISQIHYNPNAQCPEWKNFLSKVMNGNDRMIRYLQHSVGYNLTGHTDERCIFINHGTGKNGKTIFIEIIARLLGDYAIRTPTESLMSKKHGGGIPNDIARLNKIRFTYAAENEQGRKLNEALIKELSGGDTISARFMRGEFFDFEPEYKIWLSTNHKPIISGSDDAVWDRIKLIPWKVRISPNEQIPKRELLGRLEKELSGILVWAVQGCLEWRKYGLQEPAEVTGATADYRGSQDALSAFINECCVVKASAKVTKSALTEKYRKWCFENGEDELNRIDFKTELEKRGFWDKKSGVHFWCGIGLLDDISFKSGYNADGIEVDQYEESPY